VKLLYPRLSVWVCKPIAAEIGTVYALCKKHTND